MPLTWWKLGGGSHAPRLQVAIKTSEDACEVRQYCLTHAALLGSVDSIP